MDNGERYVEFGLWQRIQKHTANANDALSKGTHILDIQDEDHAGSITQVR